MIDTISRKWICYLALGSLSLLSAGSADQKLSEDSGLIAPEGFTIERIVAPDLLSYPMLASFDENGRLFVFESTGPNTNGTEEMLKNPSYRIRLLEDTDQNGLFEKSTIFADHIPFPKGGVFFEGSLYVAEAPNLAKYTDTDQDGVSDTKEIILSGWNFHANGATLSGPFLGPDGWLYLTDARRGFNIRSKEGKMLSGKGTRIWRCRPDGTGLEAMAGGGFDNSIELAFMPSGETVGTMTYFVNPQDGQRDAIMHWVEGGTYPKPHPVIAEDSLKLTGPLMPVMTKLARVAPSGIMRYRGNAMGDDFRDNLFTAEFNTGRIMRYRIEQDGATFKTTDEVFIRSSVPDSHPTDVLQDADGSLLVVVTGGWFSEGCPLSRVAKPDLRGGIYRIKKTGASKMDDPWGKQLNSKSLPTSRLTNYLIDPRPIVRDRISTELLTRGDSAATAIARALPDIKDPELRAAAVFTLSRIGSEMALGFVRKALNDENAVVRTAAARVLGLAKDQKSVARLSEIVERDELPVRRQAATALGQIGDKHAVKSLINAAGEENDRFTNHAIIYALIVLQDPAPLVAALRNASVPIQNATLIALDQMNGSPLKKEHLAVALASKNPLVRATGIWIAGHHPEWTSMMVDFLTKTMDQKDLSDAEITSMRNLMLTFIKEPELQQFLAGQLHSAQLSAERKSMLLDVVDKCSMKELPQSWIEGIKYLLQNGGPAVQSRIFSLIESRRIASLNGQLDHITANSGLPADLRLRSLGARVMSAPKLSEQEFEFLNQSLSATKESPIRQRSARILGQATLTEPQLLNIAQNVISKAEPFLLPGLLEVFEGSTSEQVGRALLEGIAAGDAKRLDNVSEQDLQRVLKTYPNTTHKLAQPLLAKIRAKHSERLSNLRSIEARMKGGDVGAGRKLFFGKASCYLCHAVGPDGGHFGPDLTNIGEIRSKHDILEAIVYPSASFAREYESVKVITKTGEYIGIVKEELPETIVLEVGPAPGLRIPRTEVIRIEPQTMSMMPPGLDQALSESEMAHLTAFLEALPYRIDRMLKAKELNENKK